MTENLSNTLDKGGFVAAIFMNLLKVFDTLNRNLLIAKLEPYSFCKRRTYLYEKVFKW